MCRPRERDDVADVHVIAGAFAAGDRQAEGLDFQLRFSDLIEELIKLIFRTFGAAPKCELHLRKAHDMRHMTSQHIDNRGLRR